MRVDPSEKVAGVTMRELRRVFRLLSGEGAFYVEWLCARLRLDAAAGDDLLRELMTCGFVEPYQSAIAGLAEPGRHELAMKGHALASARFGRRFSRETAARLIDSVKTRAAAVNADKWMPAYVGEIRVFGSWLSDSDNLGDVDLAVRLERRYAGDVFIELNDALVERDEFTGSFFQRLCYSDTAVYRRLKCRDGRISIHHIDDLKNIGVSGNRIFKSGAVAREDPALLLAKAGAEMEADG